MCAGLRDQLVARSHECDFPPGVEALPALTRARVDSSRHSAEIDEQVRNVVASRLPIYTLDEAKLAALTPDVVAYLNRPGPRIVEAVEVIAAWLRCAPVPAHQRSELALYL